MQKNTIWIQTGWRLQVCVRCFEVSNITQVGNVSLPYCKTNIGKDSLRFQGRILIIFHSTEFHNASSNVVFTSKLSCHKFILFLLVCLCVPLPPFPFSLLLRICAFCFAKLHFILNHDHLVCRWQHFCSFGFPGLPWASLPHIFYKWRKIKTNKRK